MRDIYSYLNSISDLLAGLQTEHGTINIERDLLDNKDSRYRVSLPKPDSSYYQAVYGWGPSPAAAYDNALEKLQKLLLSKEAAAIKAKYDALAKAEIEALHSTLPSPSHTP